MLLTLPSAVRIYLAADPVDLRRGFDGLAATRSLIGSDPLSGHVLVFLNRRKNRVKLLAWDRTGYVLPYSRAEAGHVQDADRAAAGAGARGGGRGRVGAHAGGSGPEDGIGLGGELKELAVPQREKRSMMLPRIMNPSRASSRARVSKRAHRRTGPRPGAGDGPGDGGKEEKRGDSILPRSLNILELSASPCSIPSV